MWYTPKLQSDSLNMCSRKNLVHLRVIQEVSYSKVPLILSNSDRNTLSVAMVAIEQNSEHVNTQIQKTFFEE